MSVSEIEFPNKTAIYGKESQFYYRDSYMVKTNKNNLEAKHVYFYIFAFIPKPVRWALHLRNAIVKWLGFSTSNTQMSLPLEDIKAGRKAGFLTIESVSHSELVCGAYEKNMDMWLSVLKLSENEFAISILVNLKTKSGKLYMAMIKPFHKLIATYTIKQAIRAGRI